MTPGVQLLLWVTTVVPPELTMVTLLPTDVAFLLIIVVRVLPAARAGAEHARHANTNIETAACAPHLNHAYSPVVSPDGFSDSASKDENTPALL